MFKFGFSADTNEDNTNDENISEQKWNECKELTPTENKLVESILARGQFIIINNVEIKCVCPSKVLEVLQSEKSSNDVSVLKAEQNHSDLLPAVYEGGFKIWECTYDLLNYLMGSKFDFQNKMVLDLGCGAGILGIYALLRGSTSYFQDYNTDVIEYITIPNVLLNSKDDTSECKFYSGDWDSFTNYLQNERGNKDCKFDFIFSSETIYNTKNYLKLHTVFERLLKRTGMVLLAAKSFYFGVGGGISLFEDFIEKRNVFKYSCCWKCTEGVKREILMIQFKDSCNT